MDYEKFIKDILTYLELNLPDELAIIETENPDLVLPIPDLYIEDIPDTDRSESVILFLLVPDYNYEELSNESKMLSTDIEIYMTFKNIKGKSDVQLGQIAKRYAKAVYSLINKQPSVGISGGYGIVTSSHYYNAVEGFASAKAIKLMIKFVAEI